MKLSNITDIINKMLISTYATKLRVNAAYYGLRNEKMLNMYRSMEYLDLLNLGSGKQGGDFWEFGVASGYSLINAYYTKQRFKNLYDMKFIGFDSFEGLPDVTHNNDKNTYWKAGDFGFGVDYVKQNIKRAHIPESEYKLIPGYYENSLNQETVKKYDLKSVCYVHVDCDLYTSTVSVLDFIKPFLTQGAIIDFDDYYCYTSDNFGEPKAFKEWLDKNSDIESRVFSRYSSFGQTYTVSVKG